MFSAFEVDPASLVARFTEGLQLMKACWTEPRITFSGRFWQLDGALFKRFALGASRYAEFRVDVYNVTNSVRWGNPTTGFSTSSGNTFGQVTGIAGNSGPRSIRFGGRFAF